MSSLKNRRETKRMIAKNGNHLFYSSFPGSDLKNLIASGSVVNAARTSAIGWAVSMPVTPRKCGRISISGMKYSPLRSDAAVFFCTVVK